jgi:hypothetical protein
MCRAEDGRLGGSRRLDGVMEATGMTGGRVFRSTFGQVTEHCTTTARDLFPALSHAFFLYFSRYEYFLNAP